MMRANKSMLLKCDNIKNKPLKRIVEHIFYLIMVLVLIPAFTYFELIVVFPTVEEEWMVNLIHVPLALFALQNFVSNAVFGMLTDSSIRGKFLYKNNNNKTHWSFCPVCECLKPPRAWHCDICNICILKRDHHCTFFTSCVGYYNYRYFLIYTMYVFMAMVYAIYFNVKFLVKIVSWNHGLPLLKFMFPMLYFVFDFGVESMYILMFVCNIFISGISGYLLYFHMENVLNGQTTHERKYKSNDYNKGLISNLVEVFGSRWYLTWISPLIPSPLPGDGIKWDEVDKYK